MISGNVRDGDHFELTNSPTSQSASTFTALVDGKMIVSKYAKDMLAFSDDTPILAHWHGEYSTDAFSMIVSQLRAKVDQFYAKNDAMIAERKARKILLKQRNL